MSKNILQEAEELVHGDRAKAYGHPSVNFKNIADGWSVILGIKVTPEQVALCMCWTKIARHVHSPKRDNLVDLAGYAATIEMLKEVVPEMQLPPEVFKTSVENKLQDAELMDEGKLTDLGFVVSRAGAEQKVYKHQSMVGELTVVNDIKGATYREPYKNGIFLPNISHVKALLENAGEK